ncbi:MAG: hypothetical protein HY900_32090, partial [Deltaproteobacteria bacterium]|nr:hypothetical protein [Deltaproteobacteria bacterium]
MGVLKDLLPLDAQGDQVVDAEEPPVVDLLSGDLPVRESKVLAAQQMVELVEA